MSETGKSGEQTISNRDQCPVCHKLRFEHPEHTLCEPENTAGGNEPIWDSRNSDEPASTGNIGERCVQKINKYLASKRWPWQAKDTEIAAIINQEVGAQRRQRWGVFNNGAINTRPDGSEEVWGSIVLPDGVSIGMLPLKACERIVAVHNASL